MLEGLQPVLVKVAKALLPMCLGVIGAAFALAYPHLHAAFCVL